MLLLFVTLLMACSAPSNLNPEFETLSLQYSTGYGPTEGSINAAVTVDTQDSTIFYLMTKGTTFTDELSCESEMEISDAQLNEVKTLIGNIGYTHIVTGREAADAGSDFLRIENQIFNSEICPDLECDMITVQDMCQIQSLIKEILGTAVVPECFDDFTEIYSILLDC